MWEQLGWVEFASGSKLVANRSKVTLSDADKDGILLKYRKQQMEAGLRMKKQVGKWADDALQFTNKRLDFSKQLDKDYNCLLTYEMVHLAMKVPMIVYWLNGIMWLETSARKDKNDASKSFLQSNNGLQTL